MTSKTSKKSLESFVDEADRLLSTELVMQRICRIANKANFVLTDSEIASLRKVAEAERSIFITTMLMDDERAEKLIDLVNNISDYADEVSDVIMFGSSSMTLQ